MKTRGLIASVGLAVTVVVTLLSVAAVSQKTVPQGLSFMDGNLGVEYLGAETGRITSIKDFSETKQPMRMAEVELKRDGEYIRYPAFFYKDRKYARNQRVQVHRYRITNTWSGTQKTQMAIEP
jgi:hypothetical protein